MANLVVYVELRGGAPTAPSLFALAEARRVSAALGATVYAVATTGEVPSAELESLARQLGLAGADKVLASQDASLAGPTLDGTHGEAIAAAAERIRPALILLPAGAVGEEIGPRLATRLNAAFVPAADLLLEARPGGVEPRLVIRRWRPGRTALRVLDPQEAERPAVVTLRAGRVPEPCGTEDVEMQIVPYSCPDGPRLLELDAADDELAAADTAQMLVVLSPEVGSGVGPVLRAAAPPAVVVVTPSGPDADALEAACPDLLLRVGEGAGSAGVAPSTRVGVILPAADEGAGSLDADVVWRPSGDAAAEELVRALAALPAAATGAAGGGGSS